MTDKIEFEYAMKRSGYNYTKVAELLKLSAAGLWQKVNNVTEFKVSEVSILMNAFSLNDESIKKIFFAQNGELNGTAVE